MRLTHSCFLHFYLHLSPARPRRSLYGKKKQLYEEVLNIRNSVEELKCAIESARRDRELYEFQLDEMDGVKIAPDEDIIVSLISVRPLIQTCSYTWQNTSFSLKRG